MRIARGALVLAAIVLLIALTTTSAGAVLFDLLAPVWFVFAAIVVFRLCWRSEEDRPAPAPFLAPVPLRAPPVQ